MQGFDVVLHECYPIMHIASLIACQLYMRSYFKYACYDDAWSMCMVLKFFLCKGLMIRAADEFWIWTSVLGLWYGLRSQSFGFQSHDYGFKRIACEHSCMFHHFTMWKSLKWYTWLFCLSIPMALMFSSIYTCWILWLMFTCIILGEGKTREEDKPSEFGVLE